MANHTPRPFRTQEAAPDARQLDVSYWQYRDDGSSLGKRMDGAVGATIHLGHRGVETVTPAYGEPYEVTRWARRVELHVSPSGRSARVWVDGQEVVKDPTAAARRAYLAGDWDRLEALLGIPDIPPGDSVPVTPWEAAAAAERGAAR